MSAWRKRALELFPEQRRIIENKREFTSSIYQLFFDLLPDAEQAHQENNIDLLKRIYKFAEWCWKQKRRAPDIYNAVIVAFYEHLVDESSMRTAVAQWLKPEIFDDLQEVFRQRL